MTAESEIPISDTLFLQYIIDGRGGKNLVIRLLEEVHNCGSINKAAKVLGVGYKAAWERLENLNNIAPEPLIIRQSKGKSGTELTTAGLEFLERSDLLRREFASFLNYFYFSPEEAFNTYRMLRMIEQKISARNVWLGKVSAIERGVVNSVVTIALKGKDSIVSMISDDSVQQLGLSHGMEVLVIVKASSVMLGHEIASEKISARNLLRGQVHRLVPGAVNDEITIDLACGNTVTAIVTSASAKRLDITVGSDITAVIKASDVVLATT